MPGPKPEQIELDETVRQELEKLAGRHTTGQQKAQRARIILKAAEGRNNAEIGYLRNTAQKGHARMELEREVRQAL
jgi:hypothetical protein